MQLFYKLYLERKNAPLRMTTSCILCRLWSASSRILLLIIRLMLKYTEVFFLRRVHRLFWHLFPEFLCSPHVLVMFHRIRRHHLKHMASERSTPYHVVGVRRRSLLKERNDASVMSRDRDIHTTTDLCLHWRFS